MATATGIDAGDSTPTVNLARALLTRDGELALRSELERLLAVRGEFSARLREARTFGETHENDDYLQAKEEEAVLASRIHQLETLLDSAEVVDEPSLGRGVAGIGSLIEVENLKTGSRFEHRLLGGYEPLGPGDISANSPVGQALLGRSADEEVTVELPGGRSINLRVTRVRRDSTRTGRSK